MRFIGFGPMCDEPASTPAHVVLFTRNRTTGATRVNLPPLNGALRSQVPFFPADIAFGRSGHAAGQATNLRFGWFCTGNGGYGLNRNGPLGRTVRFPEMP